MPAPDLIAEVVNIVLQGFVHIVAHRYYPVLVAFALPYKNRFLLKSISAGVRLYPSLKRNPQA